MMSNKETRTSKILSSVGRELKNNPPSILKKTQDRSGKKAAGKQRVAILLSKARDRGANIPKYS